MAATTTPFVELMNLTPKTEPCDHLGKDDDDDNDINDGDNDINDGNDGRWREPEPYLCSRTSPPLHPHPQPSEPACRGRGTGSAGTPPPPDSERHHTSTVQRRAAATYTGKLEIIKVI